MHARSSLRRSVGAAVVALGLALAAAGARAQFAVVPMLEHGQPAPSAAATVLDYKRDVARYIYSSFPQRIYRGRLPPLLYGVAVVDMLIDAEGQLIDLQLRRPPSAPEVGPWVLSMVRRAAPFPAPTKLGEAVRFSEIWLVDKGGNFQVDTLTEGQR